VGLNITSPTLCFDLDYLAAGVRWKYLFTALGPVEYGDRFSWFEAQQMNDIFFDL
jgi:hypothetical protein